MINHHQLDYKYFNIMMRNNLSNLAPFSYETKLIVIKKKKKKINHEERVLSEIAKR